MTVVVAIVEGVERSLLQSLTQRGELDWFSRKLASSSYFKLGSGVVPYEPPNLTSAFSGVSPGEHGCFSYWECDSDRGLPRILDANDVKAPRVWNWPELAHKKFGVLNVQLTHPPTAINGFLISYLMQQSLHYTYPADLARRLNADGIRYAHDVSAFYRGEAAEFFSGEVTRIAQFQLDAALHLASSVDILILNLTLADRVSHFLWAEVENKPLDSNNHIVQAYRFLDAALARLEEKSAGDPMLVFSEMGFGPIDYFVSLDAELQKRGLQVLDNQGKVNVTKSVAMETVQGTHGLKVIGNSAGYDLRVEEVCGVLKELIFQDGSPIVADAQPREEVFHGPYVHLAPDIVITPANLRRPPMGDQRWARHVNRELQTGWHRSGGFGLLVGGALAVSGDEFALESIAPTVARLLGSDIPSFCKHPSLVA